MGAGRRKNRRGSAFGEGHRGEAPDVSAEGSEALVAVREPESPASGEGLMEEVCDRDNLRKALKRVKSNRGSPGVDGMTVEELSGHLAEHWPVIREQLLGGTYVPRAVKRVEIPKADGGVRQLGIPTVLDRFIQQALLQVLQGRWDRTFSDHSFGFRPGRGAHQAVSKAQEYIADGYRWVVDTDLEKFFDRVNHDMLMGRVARRVSDKRLLCLIRAYLNAGVMECGLVSPRTEGTPQGGPLSPLLSNIVLDDLDCELERRGHRFVRYADDFVIYVRSERAGHRVKENITRFIEKKLKLTVNESKSAVSRPWDRDFLGFLFLDGEKPRRGISPKALNRFKKRVRELTRSGKGRGVHQMVVELSRYLVGWRSYFGYCETPSTLLGLDAWIRRRLRCAVWRHWKRGRTRYAELRKRGVGKDLAARTAGSAHGPWHLSRSPALSFALPNAFFDSIGLARLAPA